MKVDEFATYLEQLHERMNKLVVCFVYYWLHVTTDYHEVLLP